jgi:hypothetical protein
MKRTTVFTLFALILGLLLAACSTPEEAPSTPAAEPTPPRAAANLVDASACATENHAPLDAFRSDSVGKLTASTKPKLIEFWAVW